MVWVSKVVSILFKPMSYFMALAILLSSAIR